MSIYKELKEEVCRCNIQLALKKIVVHTFGNISGIDRQKNAVAIKPSGVPYHELTWDKIVVIDLDNNIIEGNLKPSCDTKAHTLLYKTFPGIGGIVHTHSTYATAWAQAKRPIPCLGTTHADCVQGFIPCTEDLTETQVLGDYETETGKQIIKTMAGHSTDELQMILISGHGAFTWGKNPEQALLNTILLEEIAKTAWLTLTLEPQVKPLSEFLLKKHYLRKHGTAAYYGQKQTNAGER